MGEHSFEVRSVGSSRGWACIALAALIVSAGCGGKSKKSESDSDESEQPSATPAPAKTAATKSDPKDSSATGKLSIELRENKANGKPWDAAGDLPDIGVCVGPKGSGRVCYPGGGELIRGGSPAACKDSLKCDLEIKVPSGATSVALEIIDIDALSNDAVGSGTCAPGAACTLGQASVTLTVAKDGGGSAREAAPPAAPTGAAPSAVAEPRATPPAAPKVENVSRFPAPCAGLDPERHVKIEGAEELCIPKEKVRAILAFGKSFEGTPSGYSDSNEFSTLLAPNAAAGETSDTPAADRAAVAAQVRKTVYYERINGCSFTWLDAIGKANGTCDLSSNGLYVGTAPSVSKKTDCETMANPTCGECDDHDDCSGFLCGCSQSRCTIFRTCTACPAETICTDPEYTMKTTPWTVSVAPKSDAGKEAAKSLDRATLVLGFTVRSAWRKVSTGTKMNYEDKPETVVEHDSGYYLDIQPVALAAVECNGDCNAAAKVVLDVIPGVPFNATVEADGRTIQIACPKDACTAKVK